MISHRAASIALCTVYLACAGCDDSTSTPDDAGTTPTDTGVPVDASATDSGSAPIDGGTPPVDAFVPDVDGGGMPGCGGARPTITGITGTEGLVIARDGTIYYSQSGGVGRLAVGGTPDDGWVTLTGAGTVWGMVLDEANETLYVGAPMPARTVFAVDLTGATPVARPFVTAAGSPNGLTLGPDGALYFSDFGGNHVNRVELGGATGTATRVTTSPIASANGVAFLPDGTLLVASYSTGTVHRLTLTAGAETARTTFASGLGAPDGIAVDADGRVYVTNNGAGTVIRLEADGTGPMILLTGVGAAASLDFGAGALDCEDLYVASSGPMRRYEDGTAVGADVPWH